MDMNIVDENIIKIIIENQSMIYKQVKSELSGKGLSDVETGFIYWKVSDRVKEKLGVLY